MLKAAQAFVEMSKKSKKRQTDPNAEEEVQDDALEKVYQAMRLKHRDVVLSQFDMRNGAEFSLDKQSLQVKKTPYPEKFRRHFFKKLREVGLKPKLQIGRSGLRTTRRKKPMMFMNAGSQRCALHDLGCPIKPCKFASLNIKVALTGVRSKKAVKDVAVMKTLAFGKKELHAQLKKVFMTNDEINNC